MTKSRYLLLALIFAVAVCVKTMPYVLGALGLTDVKDITSLLWNFSPITALFLFCGAQFPERRWAFSVPLAALLVSDVVIQSLLGEITDGLLPGLPAVYGSYALIVAAGSLLRKLQLRGQQTGSAWAGLVTGLLVTVVAAGLGIAGEAVFFLSTNFSFWVAQTSFYPHTVAGLVECYVAAIPFAKHAFASTPLYSVLLFGGAAIVANLFPAVQQRPIGVADNTKPALAA